MPLQEACVSGGCATSAHAADWQQLVRGSGCFGSSFEMLVSQIQIAFDKRVSSRLYQIYFETFTTERCLIVLYAAMGEGDVLGREGLPKGG